MRTGAGGLLGKDSVERLREGASLAEPRQSLLTVALEWPCEQERQNSLPSECVSSPPDVVCTG